MIPEDLQIHYATLWTQIFCKICDENKGVNLDKKLEYTAKAFSAMQHAASGGADTDKLTGE